MNEDDAATLTEKSIVINKTDVIHKNILDAEHLKAANPDSDLSTINHKDGDGGIKLDVERDVTKHDAVSGMGKEITHNEVDQLNGTKKENKKETIHDGEVQNNITNGIVSSHTKNHELNCENGEMIVDEASRDYLMDVDALIKDDQMEVDVDEEMDVDNDAQSKPEEITNVIESPNTPTVPKVPSVSCKNEEKLSTEANGHSQTIGPSPDTGVNLIDQSIVSEGTESLLLLSQESEIVSEGKPKSDSELKATTLDSDSGVATIASEKSALLEKEILDTLKVNADSEECKGAVDGAGNENSKSYQETDVSLQNGEQNTNVPSESFMPLETVSEAEVPVDHGAAELRSLDLENNSLKCLDLSPARNHQEADHELRSEQSTVINDKVEPVQTKEEATNASQQSQQSELVIKDLVTEANTGTNVPTESELTDKIVTQRDAVVNSEETGVNVLRKLAIECESIAPNLDENKLGENKSTTSQHLSCEIRLENIVEHSIEFNPLGSDASVIPKGNEHSVVESYANENVTRDSSEDERVSDEGKSETIGQVNLIPTCDSSKQNQECVSIESSDLKSEATEDTLKQTNETSELNVDVRGEERLESEKAETVPAEGSDEVSVDQNCSIEAQVEVKDQKEVNQSVLENISDEIETGNLKTESAERSSDTGEHSLKNSCKDSERTSCDVQSAEGDNSNNLAHDVNAKLLPVNDLPEVCETAIKQSQTNSGPSAQVTENNTCLRVNSQEDIGENALSNLGCEKGDVELNEGEILKDTEESGKNTLNDFAKESEPMDVDSNEEPMDVDAEEAATVDEEMKDDIAVPTETAAAESSGDILVTGEAVSAEGAAVSETAEFDSKTVHDQQVGALINLLESDGTTNTATTESNTLTASETVESVELSQTAENELLLCASNEAGYEINSQVENLLLGSDGPEENTISNEQSAALPVEDKNIAGGETRENEENKNATGEPCMSQEKLNVTEGIVNNIVKEGNKLDKPREDLEETEDEADDRAGNEDSDAGFPGFASILEATTIAPTEFENMESLAEYDGSHATDTETVGVVSRLTELARNVLEADDTLNTPPEVPTRPNTEKQTRRSPIALRSIKQEKMELNVHIKEEMMEEYHSEQFSEEPIDIKPTVLSPDLLARVAEQTSRGRKRVQASKFQSPIVSQSKKRERTKMKKSQDKKNMNRVFKDTDNGNLNVPQLRARRPQINKAKRIVTPVRTISAVAVTRRLISQKVTPTNPPKKHIPAVTVTPFPKPIPVPRQIPALKLPSLPKQEPPARKIAPTRSSLGAKIPPARPIEDLEKRRATRSSLPVTQVISPSPSVEISLRRKRPEAPTDNAKLIKKPRFYPLPDAVEKYWQTPNIRKPNRNVAVKSTTPKPPPTVGNSKNVAVKRGKPYYKNQGEPETAPIFVDTSFGNQSIDMFINENDDDDNPQVFTTRTRKRASDCSGSRYEDISDRHWNRGRRSQGIKDNTMLKCQVKIKRMPVIDRLIPTKKTPEKLEPNVCELCDPKRIFLSKTALADHITTEHISRSAETSVTPASTSASANELTICINENTDSCVGCKRKFYSKNRLINHIKTCKSVLEMPQQIEPSPPSALPTPKINKLIGSIPGVDLTLLGKNNVTISKMSASEKKSADLKDGQSLLKHVCPICGRRFLMETGLKSHLKTHKPVPARTGSAKPGKFNLICNICDKTFDLCSDLVDHMSFHSLPSEKEKDILSMNMNKISRIQISLQKKEILEVLTSSSEMDGYSEDSSDYSDDDKRNVRKTVRIECQPSQCSECGRLFTIKAVYERHMSLIAKISSLEDQTKCPICDIEIKFRCKLGAHLETHKPRSEEQLTCSKCNKSFRCENNLIRHQLEHEGKLRANCQYCRVGFNSMSDLYTHQEECKLKCSEYKCNVCRRVFTAKWRLELHMKTDEKHGTDPQQPNTYFCDQCGREFKHLSVLKRHVDSRCGTEPLYECTDCGKKYFSQGSLASHKRTQHSTEKNFMCQYCSKDFFTKHQLHRHELRHNPDVRPYRCKYPNCEKTYRQPDSLRAHECEHTGVYPYACEFCGIQFSNVKSLKLHRKSSNHWSESEPNKVVTQACRLRHVTGRRPTEEENPQAEAKQASEEEEIDPEGHEDEPKNLVISESQYEGVYPSEQVAIPPQVPQYSTLQPFTVNHLMHHNQQNSVLVQSNHPLASYTQAIENYFVIASHQEHLTGTHHHSMIN